MARTIEGRGLTEANRRAQLRAAQRSMVKARIAYNRFLDVADLDASFPTWVVMMQQIIGQGFDKSAVLAENYLRRFAVAEKFDVPDMPSVIADAALIYDNMLVNGPISIKQKIADGFGANEAKALAMERFLGVVQERVMDGGRDLIIGVSKYYGRSGRWRRVTDGQPCAFCAMLAGRGPVYTSETVTFQSHNHCGCTAEMVVGEWEPTAKERLWRASYDMAAMDADAANEPRLAPVRKKNQEEDTILWRMRRNAPDLFSDGVHPSKDK